MTLSPRIIFVFVATPGLMLVQPTAASAVMAPAVQDDTPTSAPVRRGAVNAALGVPSASAEYDPNTTADPGFTSRRRGTSSDTTYGSSSTTVAPDGSLINGLQIYDPNLAPGDPGYVDETPEYHVVQRGDTLWDISGYYLVDPYAWPKLWSWNEHVTNAHWIFPGDRIRLYDPLKGRRKQEGPSLAFRRTSLPPGRGVGTYMLNQIAFVDAAEFDTSMKIVGGGDAKVMMATLDTVYMSYDSGNPPIPGERLVVYAPTRKIRDPETKKVKGYIVQLMGEVEVDSVARKAAEGTVMKSLNPVERGYRVGPLRRVFRRIEATEPERSATGEVMATLTGTGPMNVKIRKTRRSQPSETLAGEEQFVVVNLGSNDGIKAGNVLEVVRKGDEYTPKRIYNHPYEEGWPRRVVGALLVVEVQPELSLAVSVFSRREIEAGDHVEMRGPGLDDDDENGSGRDGPDADANFERSDDGVKGDAGFKLGG